MSIDVGIWGLAHGHIWAMAKGLVEVGACIRSVYDADSVAVQRFCQDFPTAQRVENPECLLNDSRISLIASAAIPSERAGIGLQALAHGKHFFAAKPLCTTLADLEALMAVQQKTKLQVQAWFCERLASPATLRAQDLVAQGAIGKVVHLTGFGPHRLGAGRPDWFWNPRTSGGILCDLASHQCEQFLAFAGDPETKVVSARTNKRPDGFEDFGELSLLGAGVSAYSRVDWLSSEGLKSWGDGRLFLVGTEGSIEVRKNLDITRSDQGGHLFLVNRDGERYEQIPSAPDQYFRRLITDCLDGGNTALPQARCFAATRLSIQAQNLSQQNQERISKTGQDIQDEIAGFTG
jgi:predicted dehydrogenase